VFSECVLGVCSHSPVRRSALIGALGLGLLLFLGDAGFGDVALGDAETAGEPVRGARSAYANPVLRVVVEMTRAGVPTPTILAYLRVRRVLIQEDVETKDLVRLRKDGVAEEVIAYVAKQSRLDVPQAEPEAPVFDAEPPPPKAGRSKAIDPDPGDTGLIMGVYDPIPTGASPCWPPSLAPYQCGERGIVVWEGASPRGREGRGSRSPDRERSNDRSTTRAPRSSH
jgi:hypothetical protein